MKPSANAAVKLVCYNVLEGTGTLQERVEVSAAANRCTVYLCAPDVLSSTNECGLAPRKLIFGETDYSFFSERPVPACSLNYYD